MVDDRQLLVMSLIDSRFTGPKITLSLDDLSESQERTIAEEGLQVNIVDPGEAGTDSAPISKEVENSKADV